MLKATATRGATTDQAPQQFPRKHLLVVAALALLTSSVLILLPADNVSAGRKQVQAVIPAATIIPTADPAPEPEPQWQSFDVRAGDSLSRVFQRAGLNDSHVYEVVHRADHGKDLTNIYPGQTLRFRFDPEGNQLLALQHQVTRLQTTTYTRTEQGFDTSTKTRTPEAHRAFVSATVNSSLFLAGQKAGMSGNLIMEMANIFGGVIDFVLDPRQGDEFHVLYEELYLDGEKFSTGKILAAEYTNKGKSHTAFRYVDEKGKVGYFSETGVSMRKAFLLAPVDFTRISSNFNPRRLHPIYKTRRPHRGTDYAAPRGTPVFAAGDGRVVAAGYTKANGNYLTIQHGQQYTTKYLHLTKKKVKKGQRVTQQQIIGTVGSTGAATGPHLHYEFLVNGVHRNPRTIHKKLPKAKSLNTVELARFKEQTRTLDMQLASLRQTTLASIDNSTPGAP